VKDEGKLDNTLLVYIAGDNGTSPEGSLWAHQTSSPPITGCWMCQSRRR
jgi:arylsulfatase A-like enzyme